MTGEMEQRDRRNLSTSSPARRAVERFITGILQPITAALVRRRVHPNVLTVTGFVVTISSAAFFCTNHIRTAGMLILIGGIFDIFDGRVARATGLASQFGSFFDSTLDRFSEIAVYVGIMTLYNQYQSVLGDVITIYAVLLAATGSLMVSYTRARAEAVGIDCSVGWMQRPERVLLIGLSSLIFGDADQALALRVVIIALAVLTNLTAVQRVIWVYRKSRPTGVMRDQSGAPRPPW